MDDYERRAVAKYRAGAYVTLGEEWTALRVLFPRGCGKRDESRDVEEYEEELSLGGQAYSEYGARTKRGERCL